ncbi:MAG: histidine phosphatase family protein [Magnetococcales bacterium]|nr:histidine phosphatase family protein [Magnetococcales bacterium]
MDNKVEKITTIDLIRHGEPQGGEMIRGSVDHALSTEGWCQMKASVGDHHPWQWVVSSPMARCYHFARWVAERWALPLTIEPDLREMGFGEWEGLRKTEMTVQQRQDFRNFWLNPLENAPPKGTTMTALKNRVIPVVERLMKERASSHGLIVAHGAVNRVIIGHMLDMPLSHLFRLEIPYAAMSRLSRDDARKEPRWSLHFHNGVLCCNPFGPP